MTLDSELQFLPSSQAEEIGLTPLSPMPVSPMSLNPTPFSPALSSPPQPSGSRVVVVLEQRFAQTPDGAVWTPATNAYGFWGRYLDVFDTVHVVARLQPISHPPAGWRRADGLGVSFAAVPYYVGPRQYLQKVRQVRQAVRQAVTPQDAVILRVGSPLANTLEPWLRQQQHPYAVEVVADPYDVLAPGSIQHPLRPWLRGHLTRQLQRQCAGAIAAAYVTEAALQRRYPCAPLAIGVSDVELPPEAFATTPRTYRDDAFQDCPIRLLFIGTLAQLYKAPHILLDAIAATVAQGIDLQVSFVGEGQYRPQLETQAQHLGIASRITWLGQLSSSEAVREQLAQADVFVMPSFQEGLPRAMVEAMAQGLPCIGSAVGGIPELLAQEDLVPSGDVAALARKLCEVVRSPERLTLMSLRNWQRAQGFESDILQTQRRLFYRHVRQQTEARLQRRTREMTVL